MREFNSEMLAKLTSANESLKGTPNYYRYHMATCCKSAVNGKWFFVGHYIPHQTGVIRKAKGNTYIYTTGGDRYELNEAVKELLGI